MEQKNDKVLFGVMTILFHACGVPYFMRGKKGEGVKHIILSCVTFSIMACVYGIQGIIRGVKVLKMTDEAYMAAKYGEAPAFVGYN